MKTNWETHINISYLHSLYEGGHITFKNLGLMVAKKLQSSKFYSQKYTEFVDIACEFEDLADNELSDIDDYHIALNMLYDFGDKDKRIWIETLLNELDLKDEEAEFKKLVENVENKLTKEGFILSEVDPMMLHYLLKTPPDYQDKVVRRWKRGNVKSITIVPKDSLIEID